MGVRLPRASGILLHPTSLPSRFGIGDLGPEALVFLDLLAETGQHWWQMLPLGPTGFGNSPYQSPSSFAGNPLLISPELMAEEGWISPQDWRDYPSLPDGDVDFDAVSEGKERLFRRAFRQFPRDDPGMAAFLHANRDWLEEYAFFMALKEAHGGVAWNDWERPVAFREPTAMASWRERLDEDVRYHQFVQYVFAHQWESLRHHCRDRNIELIGDLPIFVSMDSVDVWARPDLFQLDEERRPIAVSGVPPDYFSETGQLWGNPLYRWQAHAVEKYSWWISRLKATMNRVDLLRLDHFRGFESYWAVPAGEETAVNGRWVRGPGAPFFEAVRDALGGLPLIAEDLGLITPEVEELRDRFELPGMRVLQFAFGDDAKANDFLPYRYIRHCIAYTGTHDNDTTFGWFHGSEGNTTQSAESKAAERDFVLRYVGTDGHEIHWDMIRQVMASVADTAIVPLQDVLGLDSSGRMNLPGRATGNWHWRYHPGQPDARARARLADFAIVYNRWNGRVPDHHHRYPLASARGDQQGDGDRITGTPTRPPTILRAD